MMTTRDTTTRFSAAIFLVGALLAPMIVRADTEPEPARARVEADGVEDAHALDEDEVGGTNPFGSTSERFVDDTTAQGSRGSDNASDDETLPDSSDIVHRLAVGAATGATAAVVTVAMVTLAIGLPYLVTEHPERTSLSSEAGAIFVTTLLLAPAVVAFGAGNVGFMTGGVWSGITATLAAPLGLVGGTVIGIFASGALSAVIGGALVASGGNVDEARRAQLMTTGAGYGALIGIVGGTLGGAALASGLAAALFAKSEGPLSE